MTRILPTWRRPSGVISSKADPDPFWNNTALLLHCDGSNNSTTFTDSSKTTKTVTAYGDAKISTAQSMFGGASAAFDGTGDYLTVGSSSEFAFGTGDFLIETYIRITTVQDASLYDSIGIGGAGARNSGLLWLVQSTGKLNVFAAASFRGASATTLTANRWYHLALTRYLGTWNYWIDGVKDATSFSLTHNITDTAPLIGRVGDTTGYNISGYLDEYRVTRGAARYLSAFTPPSVPFPDR